MNVVSNASPLITLARLDSLYLLSGLFSTVFIAREVYEEIVVEGQGMPGASAVAGAHWIKVLDISNPSSMLSIGRRFSLGAGETSAVILAQELGIDLVLMDERRGRRMATQMGLAVIGCVGLLEVLYRRGDLSDLRSSYRELVDQGIRIDRRTLDASLRRHELPPL